jgi:hypothetical protein
MKPGIRFQVWFFKKINNKKQIWFQFCKSDPDPVQLLLAQTGIRN